MMSVSKGLDDLESMPEYKVGLWRSPFVKIYSIGGKNRIAEISNYPRAYKDTTRHVYAEDTPFTVTEGDFNGIMDGERIYLDYKGGIYRLGEGATHWKGTSLPGAFPLWVESENLPFTPNPDEHVFLIGKTLGPIRDLSEGVIKAGPVFVKLPEQALSAMREHLPTGKITQRRKPAEGNRQIIRIRYRRVP